MKKLLQPTGVSAWQINLSILKISVLSLIASLALGSCASMMHKGSQKTAAAPEVVNMGEDWPVNFTILQMNDVYEISPLEQGRVGGMARVAALREQLLQENDNVLTVLAGDFVSPSLLGTLKYQGQPIKGRQMVDVMNELGVNLVAFGNHEFDIKEGELQQRLNESYFEWLGTNVMHRNGNRIEPFYKEIEGHKVYLPETYIWEVTNERNSKTLKVGFYSALLNDNQAPYVYYEDPYQEATKAFLELLAQQCDVIIGLTHLELAQDLKVAALLPKTALIMGGHEHENHIDTVGNVIITKADANAKTVWVHRFTWFPDTKFVELNSELVPITPATGEDPHVAAVVEKWNRVQQEQIAVVFDDPNEVIYKAVQPLDGREKSIRSMQTNFGSIIATAMAAAARKPVDCAFFNGGSIRLDDQLWGDVTPVDIFRALPFGGSICELELKGSILKKALEAGLENTGTGGYLQWYNIQFDEQSKSWKIGGQQLDERKTYRIATSEYVFEGKEVRLEFFNKENFISWDLPKEDDAKDLRADIRRVVVAYLKGKH